MKRHLHSIRRSVVQPLEPRLLFAAGDLDRTFSGDGKVTTDFPGNWNFPFDAELHVDGNVLIAGTTGGRSTNAGGDFLLARVNPSDGTLDTTFGGDGKVTVDFGADDSGNALAVLAGGRFAVVGTSSPWRNPLIHWNPWGMALTCGHSVTEDFSPWPSASASRSSSRCSSRSPT